MLLLNRASLGNEIGSFGPTKKKAASSLPEAACDSLRRVFARVNKARVGLSSPFRPFLRHLAASEASSPFPEPL